MFGPTRVQGLLISVGTFIVDSRINQDWHREKLKSNPDLQLKIDTVSADQLIRVPLQRCVSPRSKELQDLLQVF